MEELPTVMLPRLPRPHAREQLVDRGFRARLGAYFICLACNQSAVETLAFNNFFQLADNAQNHGPDAPLDGTPQWSTSPSEPPPIPAILRPHRRKTTRNR